MSVTFAVDPVRPATEPLETASAAELYPSARFTTRSERPLVARNHDDSRNGFLEAVVLAYAEHRPLVLSPDAVWLTIAQGFARHVGANAEQLRHRFVRHEDRKTLEVKAEEFVWPDLIEDFCGMIQQETGGDVQALLRCNFSTTGPLARMASGVVLMDVVQRYFDCEIEMICGIPEVTLEGTPEDWESIRRRIEDLASYDLEWWIAPLRAVCDEFVSASRGRPRTTFWRNMCGLEARPCAPRVVEGWVGYFFPYLLDEKRAPRWANRNWALITTSAVPSGLSSVPITMKRGDRRELVVLKGGILGVGQGGDLSLRPEIGCVVDQDLDGVTAEVIAEIARSHAPRPPAAKGRPHERFAWLGAGRLPRSLRQLYDAMDGAVLFPDSPASHDLRRRDDLAVVGGVEDWVTGTPIEANVFCDLADGRRLAYRGDWILLVEGARLRPDTPVIALEPASVLRRLIEVREVLWFDTPDFEAPARIEELTSFDRIAATEPA